MKPCRVCAQPLLWGGDKLRGVHPGCELRTPQAQPVEGPAGDPEHGGSPPADAPPVDDRAQTVPAPPPDRDTAEMEGPPCSRS